MIIAAGVLGAGKRLFKSAWGAYEHGALGFAKGAAYSALLSFFPVLTTTTAILVQMNADAISHKVTAFLFKVAPPGVEDLIRYQMTQRGARPLALPIAASLLALWAASGVMMSLMEGFQGAYQRKSSRGILHGRLISMWLVLVSIGPVVGASAMMIFGDRAENGALRLLGLLDAGETLRGGVKFLGMLARYSVAMATIMLVAALLYKFGPDAGRRRPIWPGARVAMVLWLAITTVFAWYVRNIANYNVLYGSIGAVIALCVWMYLLALSAMIGCEYNALLDKKTDKKKK
ncbi:MAG: YihY/virulence factor BrkB family protein [Acidobacteria bacterium]|nr:YihY/virulence factor BrkB family protein [Acidobacteriota bacterium]